jgi:hypothetical protein
LEIPTIRRLVYESRQQQVPVHELNDGAFMVETTHSDDIPHSVAVQARRVGDDKLIQLVHFSLKLSYPMPITICLGN